MENNLAKYMYNWNNKKIGELETPTCILYEETKQRG